MSIIPKASKIDVPDAPTITSVELIKQVIENISAQISLLDVEISLSHQEDSEAVSCKEFLN